MAVSGDASFSIDRDTLIKSSLRLVGVGSIDEDPTANEIITAAEALNIMVKAWQADGLQLWQVRSYSLTPIESDYIYTLGTGGQITDISGKRPLRIIEAYYREISTVIDVPMIRLSREEYYALSDKDTEGTPVQYYFDPQLNQSVLNIWPAPDSNFATNYTIELLYQKPLDDLDTSTDDFEFPSEWYEAIKYGLAVRLAPEYFLPITLRRQLKKEADEIKELVMDWDTEDTSIFLQPDYKGRNFNG